MRISHKIIAILPLPRRRKTPFSPPIVKADRLEGDFSFAFLRKSGYTIGMLKLRVVAVGDIKERFYREAIAEYVKRLGRWAKTEIIEVSESSHVTDTERKRTEEGEAILGKVKGKMILTDVKGRRVKSEEIATLLKDSALSGESELTFVIGGSNGVSPAVKEKADRIISFGDITLPHQLFRVVLLEQLYRAETILNGTSYHK